MDNLFEWISSDFYSIVFTLLTVLLSGVISLLISAIYFHIGNRKSLRVSVVDPIKRLLQEPYSKENYKKLRSLSEEYSAKYFRRTEKKILDSVIDAYKSVYTYKDTDVKANILYSYFFKKLEENNIDINCEPIEVEYDIFAYGVPTELMYLWDDIKKVLNKFDPDYQPNECQNSIINLYNFYCKKYYTSEKLSYFDDDSLCKVIEYSEVTEEWNKKFNEMRKFKEQFLNLKIVK